MTRPLAGETIPGLASMFVRRRHSETFFIGRPTWPRREVALGEVARLLEGDGGEAQLRTALSGDLPPSKTEGMSADEIATAVADGVAAGRFVLIGYRPRPVWSPTEGGSVDGQAETSEEEAKDDAKETPKEAITTEKSWVEITVVSKGSGEPVSDVPLLITLSSGGESEHKTDAKGTVRLDNVAAGPCLVRCELGELSRANALIFLGSGGGGEAPAAGAGQQKDAKKEGAPCIVRVEKRKVRTGDTLESLAKSVQSTWQKVAMLNFGSDDPKKINRFLRTVVGCTKKSGKNYIFDDSDTPGIILLPREWKADGFETGHSYTVEVVPAADSQPWLFSL